MKIKFLSGPRTGQIDHAPNSQEMQLLAKAGIIEIIPYRDFRERLQDEAQQQTVGTCQNVYVAESWGVDNSKTQFRTAVVIHKRGSEMIIYDGPTKDTPPSIVQQFNDAVGKEMTPHQAEWAEELRERERNKHILQEQKERSAAGALVNARK